MPPTLRLRITAETIRLELGGAGVLYEDAAVLVLGYDARTEDVVPVLRGREALSVPERLHEIDLLEVHKRRATLVPTEEARWYDGDRGFDAPPVPHFADPWQHHGEVILVRPFVPGSASVRVWGWLLRPLRYRIFAGLPRSGGALRRWWLRFRAPVEVELPVWPTSAAAHDQLVRDLWFIFGPRVRRNGVPLALRVSAPPALRDWPVVAVPFGPALAWAALFAAPGAPLWSTVTVSLSVLGAAGAVLLARRALLRGPSAPRAREESPRKLRSRGISEERARAEDFTGVAAHRLGINARDPRRWLPLGIAALVLVPCVLLLSTRMSPDLKVAMVFVTIALIGLCTWFGMWLAATRLSLGERGLTLRLHGWYSRPEHIPYLHIRHAARVGTDEGTGVLCLHFHGGGRLSFGFPVECKQADEKLLLDLEAAISSRLGALASYRVRGAG